MARRPCCRAPDQPSRQPRRRQPCRLVTDRLDPPIKGPGSVRWPPSQPAASPAAPEASTLKYDLLGTVVHSDAWRSIAILRDKNTKLQKVYTEGRKMDDALVKKIGKNYVIFERQGREEILKMKP